MEETQPTFAERILQQEAPERDDPFARLKTEQDETRQAEAALQANERAGITPDIAVDALDAERDTGIPYAVAARRREIIANAKKKTSLRDVLNGAPATRAFLRDARNAAVAQDSVDSLANIERYLEKKKPTGVLSGIGNRTVEIGAGLQTFADVVQAEGESLVFDGRLQTEGERRNPKYTTGRELSRWNARHNGYVAGTEWHDVKDRPVSALLPFIVETGLVSTPDMAAALTALPAYVAARTGELGSTRAKNDKRGYATVEDLASVLPASVGSALLERFGARGFLGLSDDVARASDLPRAVGVAALKEAATEAGQESLESVAETAFTERGFNLAETLDRAAAGAVAGGGFGGGIRAGTGSVQALRSNTLDQAENERTEQAREAFDGLRKLVEETPAFGRRPESVRQFLEEATEGQTVELDNEGLTELYQSDPDVRAILLEQLELTEAQIQQAFDGHDIEIDAAKLLTVKDKFDVLADITRTEPDGKTSRELKAEQEQSLRDIDLADLEERFAEQDQALEGFERAQRSVQEQLVGAGRTEQEAKLAGSLIGSFFRVLSNSGLDEGAVFDALGLQVLGPGQQARQDVVRLPDGREYTQTEVEGLRAAAAETIRNRPQTLGAFARAAGLDPSETFQGEIEGVDTTGLIDRQGGQDLDYIAQLAADAGYIGTDANGKADVQEFVDALAHDYRSHQLGNERVYRPEDHDAVQRIVEQKRARDLLAEIDDVQGQVTREGDADTLNQPDLNEASKREAWFAEHVEVAVVPGEAASSRQYGFRFLGREVVVSVIPEIGGDGLGEISWTFADITGETDPFAKGDINYSLAELGALTRRIIAIVEGDISTLERDAYSLVPASPQHGILYQRMMRQFVHSKYDTIVAEDREGESYVVHKDADIDGQGAVLPSGRPQPGTHQEDGTSNFGSAEEAQGAFVERIRSRPDGYRPDAGPDTLNQPIGDYVPTPQDIEVLTDLASPETTQAVTDAVSAIKLTAEETLNGYLQDAHVYLAELVAAADAQVRPYVDAVSALISDKITQLKEFVAHITERMIIRFELAAEYARGLVQQGQTNVDAAVDGALDTAGAVVVQTGQVAETVQGAVQAAQAKFEAFQSDLQTSVQEALESLTGTKVQQAKTAYAEVKAGVEAAVDRAHETVAQAVSSVAGTIQEGTNIVAAAQEQARRVAEQARAARETAAARKAEKAEIKKRVETEKAALREASLCAAGRPSSGVGELVAGKLLGLGVGGAGAAIFVYSLGDEERKRQALYHGWENIPVGELREMRAVSDRLDAIVQAQDDAQAEASGRYDRALEMHYADINNMPHTAKFDVNSWAERFTGVDAGFLDDLIGHEAADDWDAANPESTARGGAQFIESTWRVWLSKYGGKYGEHADPYSEDQAERQEAMDLRNDRRWGTMIAAEFTRENVLFLQNHLNRPATGKEAYLAHFLGRDAALRALQADPDAIAADIFPAEAEANQNVFYKRGNFENPRTVKEMIARQGANFSSDPVFPYSESQFEQTEERGT